MILIPFWSLYPSPIFPLIMVYYCVSRDTCFSSICSSEWNLCKVLINMDFFSTDSVHLNFIWTHGNSKGDTSVCSSGARSNLVIIQHSSPFLPGPEREYDPVLSLIWTMCCFEGELSLFEGAPWHIRYWGKVWYSRSQVY